MNCWRVQNLLAPFLDGELPVAEAEALGEHLADCPPCEELVRGIESLPHLGDRLPVDPEVEECLFAAFETCLRERIASTLTFDSVPDATDRRDGLIASLLRGQLRVPSSLAAGFLAIILLMGGGIVMNHSEMKQLKTSLQQRDMLISNLSERLANSAEERFAMLPDGPTDEPPLIFMPAGATSAAGLTPLLGLGIEPAVFRGGVTSATAAPYRRTAYDGPRVIH